MTPRRGAGLALVVGGLLCGCSGLEGDHLVSPGVAFEMMRDSPRMPVFDLREATDFAGPEGHLAGARSLPLAELEGRLPELRGLEASTFLVYCDGGDDCGPKGVEILKRNGFRYVVLLSGGIRAWRAKGLGCVVEPRPASPRSPRARRRDRRPVG